MYKPLKYRENGESGNSEVKLATLLVGNDKKCPNGYLYHKNMDLSFKNNVSKSLQTHKMCV